MHVGLLYSGNEIITLHFKSFEKGPFSCACPNPYLVEYYIR